MTEADIVSKMNEICAQTFSNKIGLEFTGFDTKTIKAKFAITNDLLQPMGLLHGGVSAAVVETLGSLGSALLIDLSKFSPVGLEVNANHIKGARKGEVISAEGKVLHQGKKTHVWEVSLKNQANELICHGKLTVMIIDKV